MSNVFLALLLVSYWMIVGCLLQENSRYPEAVEDPNSPWPG